VKLSELLDHVAGTMLDDRADQLDGDPDELWADQPLVRWFNEGQRRWATGSWALEYEPAPIALREGVGTYPLPPGTLRLLFARLSDTDIGLARKDVGIFYPSANSFEYTLPTGRPSIYITNGETVSVLAKPDATHALLKLHTRIVGLPSEELSLSDLDAEPQIPAQYHLDLCDWVAYRALSLPNADTEARKEALQFRDLFLSNVRQARLDKRRADSGGAYFVFGGWARGEP